MEVLLRNPDIAKQAMEAYMVHKAGPFANGITACGFASLEITDPDLATPAQHLQSIVTNYQNTHPDADPAGRNPLLLRQLLNPKEAVSQIAFLAVGGQLGASEYPSRLFMHDSPGNWASLVVCSTRSFSRGSVHIASSDPATQPLIDPAYFSHPLDLDLAARGVLHALKLAHVEPLFSKLEKDEHGNLITYPGLKAGLPKTLDEARDHAANNTVTEYHPVGTCAMLPREKGGVVDSACKVYGTTNVRVVDASIFPTHVQGNIISLVYAVAEKAADLIKGT